MSALKIWLTTLLFLTIMTGCGKDTDRQQFNCQRFKNALSENNALAVAAEINKLCEQITVPDGPYLYNRGSANDPLEMLSALINTNCDVNATVTCAACIETNPPMSGIHVTFTRPSGGRVSKTIHIRHGENKFECGSIHD